MIVSFRGPKTFSGYTVKYLRAGPRKKHPKSGSGSDGVSGEKVRYEPELDHQVAIEQKHKMEPFPIFIHYNQHAEFDKTANSKLWCDTTKKKYIN